MKNKTKGVEREILDETVTAIKPKKEVNTKSEEVKPNVNDIEVIDVVVENPNSDTFSRIVVENSPITGTDYKTVVDPVIADKMEMEVLKDEVEDPTSSRYWDSSPKIYDKKLSDAELIVRFLIMAAVGLSVMYFIIRG